MISKITLLVALATFIGIIAYNRFVLERVITGPVGSGILILVAPILLAFIIGIVVITKNSDTKPVLNVFVYITLTVGLLYSCLVIDGVQYAISKKKKKALYEKISEKGERLVDIEVGNNFELYYCNEKLYEIWFGNNKIENYLSTILNIGKTQMKIIISEFMK